MQCKPHDNTRHDTITKLERLCLCLCLSAMSMSIPALTDEWLEALIDRIPPDKLGLGRAQPGQGRNRNRNSSAFTIHAEELSGGLTNRNTLLTLTHTLTRGDGDGDGEKLRLVLRQFSEHATAHLSISRSSELANSVHANALGLAPELLHTDAHTLMVLAFACGTTLALADMQRLCSSHDSALRISAPIRKLHDSPVPRDSPAFSTVFDPARIRQGYLDVLAQHGWREHLLPGYTELEPALHTVLACLSETRPEPLVPCHNDLLAANFIMHHSGSVTIIDWEYSARNTPSFELGNLYSECQLSDSQLENLVSAYWQPEAGSSSDPAAFLRAKTARTKLCAAVAQMTWVPWAIITSQRPDKAWETKLTNHNHSSAADEFDYIAWGLNKLDLARQVLANPDQLERLLSQVKDQP